MLPSEVSITRIRDSSDFDRNGNIVRYVEYIFNVGSHGPFTEKFYAGEQDTPAIERRINTRVQQLRDIGAIPQK